MLLCLLKLVTCIKCKPDLGEVIKICTYSRAKFPSGTTLRRFSSGNRCAYRILIWTWVTHCVTIVKSRVREGRQHWKYLGGHSIGKPGFHHIGLSHWDDISFDIPRPQSSPLQCTMYVPEYPQYLLSPKLQHFHWIYTLIANLPSSFSAHNLYFLF